MAMDPAVRNHLMKKYYPSYSDASEDDEELEAARERGQYAPMATAFGALAEGAMRPKDTSVSLLAGFGQSSGGRAEISQPKPIDWGKVANSGNEGIERAEKRQERAEGRALREDEMERSAFDLEEKDKQRIKQADTNSPAAKNAQLLAKSALNAKAKEAEAAGDKASASALRQQALGLDGMTASEAAGIIELSKSTDYKDVLNNMSADKRLNTQIKHDVTKSEKTDRDVTFRLSEKYNADPTTKATAEVRTAYEKAVALAAKPSAINDISLIFNYMKANDPGSTVREGEFAMAARAGSFGDQIAGYVSQAESGQLTPDKRQAILEGIRSQAETQERRQLQVDQYFGDLATQYQARPELVIGRKRSTAGESGAETNKAGGQKVKILTEADL